MIAEQPESLESLLPGQKACSNDYQYSSKLIELKHDDQNESNVPARFRRIHSNPGGRRRRIAARRATCKLIRRKNRS